MRDNYDQKYMNEKFNSDDDLLLTRMLELYSFLTCFFFFFCTNYKSK